ncbi:hypothetical protein [Nonomuraea sp. NPDC050202]
MREVMTVPSNAGRAFHMVAFSVQPPVTWRMEMVKDVLARMT